MKLSARGSTAPVQRRHWHPSLPVAVTRRGPPARPHNACHRVTPRGLADLVVPDIDGDLTSVQTELGASFSVRAELQGFRDDGVALTYGTARQALEATSSGVCLVDRGHWPRLRLAGRDRIPLLQRFTTQDFSNLATGQGCDTVLVDDRGHALDLVTAFVSDAHVLLLVSPEGGPAALSWLQQQAAAAELKVQAQDVSSRTALLSLVGPESRNIMNELMGEDLVRGLGDAYAAHALVKFRGTPVLASVGCGLPCEGYTLICDESVAGELFSVFAAKGCLLMGQDEWECARILAGRPCLGAELGPSAARSPLEAGLYHAVSPSKTIGSEGMQALLDGEAAGSRSQLWGLELQGPAVCGADIVLQGRHAGHVSSCTTTPTGSHFALGYLLPQPEAAGAEATPQICEGMAAVVAGSPASIASIPFASRRFLRDVLRGDSAQASQQSLVVGPGAEVLLKQAEQERQRQAQEAEAAVLSRQQRIQENAARLAAWQSQLLGTVRSPGAT